MLAIETVALTKRFGRVAAVDGLNLQVAAGSVYALMGPNGAGKTTLIKLLMNLISPTSGRASMLGGDSKKLAGKGLEAIGYVSENQKLPAGMTVDSFLKFCRPFYPTWDRDLESALIDRFELPRKQKLKRLSRGIAMKVALTSALAYRPKLIVLDEPLSGLDPLVRDELMAGLLERASETTVLISSHDLAEIVSFATHVGYMDGGRLCISEPMASIRQRFRRVQITGESMLAAPSPRPPDWVNFEYGGTTARWIEANFDPERSPALARQVFGEVLARVEPITLREVFLTMAALHHSRPGAAASALHGSSR